jgi:hypothetical protein
MKQLFKLGYVACLTTALVFSGCTKDDDDDSSNKKGKQLLSQLCEYTENGVSHQELSEYKYDGKGNTIEDNYTETEDGAVTYNSKYSYEYNNKGNIIKEEHTVTHEDGNTDTDLYEIKYDNKGRMIEQIETYSQNGEILSIRTEKNKYNEYNDQIEHEYSYEETSGRNNHSNKSSYEYEYDAEGNKTKSTYYYNDELINICEFTYVGDTAKLTYYDKDGNITSNEAQVFVTVNNVKRIRTNLNGDWKTNHYYMDIDNKDGIEQYYKENPQSINFTTIEGNATIWTYEQYDNDGEIQVKSTTKTVYTDSDRTDPISYEYTSTDRNGSYKNNTDYTYDENGNLKGIKTYSDDQLTQECKNYVYDGKKVTFTRDSYHKGETEPYRISYYTMIYK